VRALFQAAQVIQFVKKPSLTEMVAKRVEFLTAYQNAAYARVPAFVDKVRAAERAVAGHAPVPGRGALSVQADGLQGRVRGGAPAHRPGLHPAIASMFEGDYKLVHHLAPPRRPPRTSRAIWSRSPTALDAQGHGCWRLKGLRGTALDPFGRTEERRTERALIVEYRQCIEDC
jgi:indolepyruvate ferredoxin oxidoreductase